MNKSFMVVIISVFTVFSFVGCSTKVTRTDINKVVDYSGRWNDTDARLVAEEMIDDCLQAQWLSEFNKEQGSDPVVIVGTVINRTHEHINSDVFIEDLQRALINSGKVKFVASKSVIGFSNSIFTASP